MLKREKQYFNSLPDDERHELERRSRLWKTHLRFEWALNLLIVLFLIYPILWFSPWALDTSWTTFWHYWLCWFVPLMLLAWFLKSHSHRVYVVQVEQGKGGGWRKFPYAGRTIVLNKIEQAHWMRAKIYLPLSPQQNLEFSALKPSADGPYGPGAHYYDYFPCCLKLLSGELLERCYMAPKSSLSGSIGSYEGMHPELLVPISNVAHISESRMRLPHDVARRVYDLGEFKWGCRMFCLEFKGGKHQCYGSSLGPIDFLQYPDGLGPGDVIGLSNRSGSGKQLTVAEHHLCIFDDESDAGKWQIIAAPSEP